MPPLFNIERKAQSSSRTVQQVFILCITQFHPAQEKLYVCKAFESSLSLLCLSNSYTAVCPPVRGDNPRALASGLAPVQADKPFYNYFIPPSP